MKILVKSIFKILGPSYSLRILEYISKIWLAKNLRKKANFVSVISSGSNNSKQSNYLNNLVLKSLEFAFNNKIKNFNHKLKYTELFNIFPGEHYRLLSAIGKLGKPKVIVEIGTFTGMSAFAFFQNHKGIIYSFDIKDFKEFQTHIDKKYRKNFTQFLVDLSRFKNFKKYQNILNKADIIFLDAPKDGIFEYKF